MSRKKLALVIASPIIGLILIIAVVCIVVLLIISHHNTVARNNIITESKMLTIPAGCIEKSRYYQDGGVDVEANVVIDYKCVNTTAQPMYDQIIRNYQNNNYRLGDIPSFELFMLSKGNFILNYQLIDNSLDASQRVQPTSPIDEMAIHIYYTK